VESDILEVKCREDVVGLGCNPPVAAKGARPAEDRLGEAHPRLGVGTENRVVEHAQGREEGKVLERPGDAEVSHSVRRCRKQLLAVESDATLLGWTMRVTVLKRVVLPAPFGPMRPQISPSATVALNSSSAVTPPKRMVTLSIDSIPRLPPCSPTRFPRLLCSYYNNKSKQVLQQEK